MKNIFESTEEEKNRIRSLHNINEQIVNDAGVTVGSGSAAPDSFTGSGKSCTAGYMWSEEEEDCVRMDIRYIRNAMKTISAGEMQDLERDLMNDSTIESMVKSALDSLHKSSQEILKDLDNKIFRGGRMSKKEAHHIIQQGKTISYISRTLRQEVTKEWVNIKEKLINDVNLYRVNHGEKVLSSEGVVKLLSILDEKTRDLSVGSYKRQEEREIIRVEKRIKDDVFDYVRWYVGNFKNDSPWISNLRRNIESRREGEVILPIIKTPEQMDKRKRFMRRWKDNQDKKPYFSPFIRNLERAIDLNLDES